MSGATTVITGGASGLGLVMARHLVKAGRSVTLVGRDAARTRAAADSLRDLAPTDSGRDAARPRTYAADLEQWSRARALAAELAADGRPVDVLINNAGAAFPRYEQTPDGAERTYALNHHAPFLLTHALLAAGVLTPEARIINMSSFVEKRGKLDTTDPDVAGTSWGKRFYHQVNVYATSKLVSLLAARDLAQRLPAGMSLYNANPGMVRGTAMNSNAGGLMRLTAPLFRPFSITPDEGVRTPVGLADASPAPRPSGGFFTDSHPDTPSPTALNDALARTVYTRTATLLGVEPLTT
ncbi:SDR family NAD(P)-dependent oxidoreductase [Streptomyces tsukubensis]|uniref:Short-chain dehydrogenase n=1 Tax=Streptomyces tsukubensis TaxID=83656 RepID=A0A1V4A028_9ACTN|nr:SDR family NAD(P)-dependent oxidoreductase [Streptomyces tsukubensis]OON71844.1 short-chain dehydrogenase [Streptomyces tsukubensis]QFR93671.1 SDR family NAD(P)-dependent oxidoreductase [Streptomyces tsukubensis]